VLAALIELPHHYQFAVMIVLSWLENLLEGVKLF